MATIQTETVPGAGPVKIGVWPLDHCAPHATCRSRQHQWVVRINFSFVQDAVVVRDWAPPHPPPPGHVIAHLEQSIAANLRAYREKWWEYQHANPQSQAAGACCLNNQMVQGQTVQSAVFDKATGKTTVAFANGASLSWPP